MGSSAPAAGYRAGFLVRGYPRQPQGKFLEGGAFDNDGNFWFVAIGTGWVSYLTPAGKLVPGFNCDPKEDTRPRMRAAGHALARRQALRHDPPPWYPRL